MHTHCKLPDWASTYATLCSLHSDKTIGKAGDVLALLEQLVQAHLCDA